LKNAISARWSKTLRCWYVLNIPNILKLAYPKLKEISKNTVETYS